MSSAKQFVVTSTPNGVSREVQLVGVGPHERSKQ